MPARPVLRAPGERQSAASEAVSVYSGRASRSMAEKDPPVQSARDSFARQSAASEAVYRYSERASRSMAEKVRRCNQREIFSPGKARQAKLYTDTASAPRAAWRKRSAGAISERFFRQAKRGKRSCIGIQRARLAQHGGKDPLIYQVMSSSNSIRLSSVGSAWMMARM